MFDGYKAERPLRSVEERDGLTVVYTRHGETADHYIERMCQLDAERSHGRGRHQTPGAQRRTPLSAALTEEQYAALDRLRRQK